MALLFEGPHFRSIQCGRHTVAFRTLSACRFARDGD